MATTNASISLSSTVIPGMNMSYYKTSTLNQGGGCDGLSKIQSGNAEYTSTSTATLLDQSTMSVTADKANKLYIKNLSSDTEEFFTIYINSEELGRLYAGDWMFIPWSAEDSGADVKVAPSVARSMKLEYILVHE